MAVVSVAGPFAHDVIVERGLLERLGDAALAAGAPRGARVLLAEDANVVAPHGDRAARALTSAGFVVARTRLVADERSKTMPAVEALWSAALGAGVSRDDVIVALGGGLVGDVVAFAASTYLRGVALLQVPTTLLAMVDASTGGKTGVNLPLPGGGLGKNLAGTFAPPRRVLVDPLTLTTLPVRELRSGLAECVKHAIIDGEDHLAWLEGAAERALALDLDTVTELVTRSVAVKAAIVTRDPRERGERALLNLGHTFAHAIETAEGLDLTHGEAVAIGLVAACDCACRLGRGDAALRERVRDLLVRCGLAVRLPRALPLADLERRMGFDKKAKAGRIGFVLPSAPGRVSADMAIPTDTVRECLLALGATA